MAIASRAGCALNEDCAAGLYCFQGYCASECTEDADCNQGTCTERGQCLAAGAISLSAEDVDLDELTIMNSPETVFEIQPGQQEIVFEMELDEPTPSNGFRYRVDRSDDPDSAEKIKRTAGDTRSVEIAIPVGQADPDLEDGRLVYVKLFTPLGNYDLALLPQHAFAGSYVGTARVNAFGSTGLPIQMQVVTEPADASLAQAERALLILPVGDEFVFSPFASDGSVDYVARELEYDEFVGRWVATFGMSFDLSNSSIITPSNDEQIRRSMRFELMQGDGTTIIGDFTDRWSGLYEVRSSSGVTRLEDVIFNGEIEADRVDQAPHFNEFEIREHEQADPQLLPAPPLDTCSTVDFTEFTAVDLDETTYDCAEIADADDFALADASEQASCAVTASVSSLDGDTTGGQLRAFLDDDIPNPGGQSFEEFLDACAEDSDATCQPSDEVLCARQLIAHSYRNQGQQSSYLADLASHYQELTREAYLGQQLSAFGADATLRLQWLETTDYPAVVTSAVKNLNEQLLDEWRQKVLEAHLDVLEGQLDASGLAVLSRQVSDEGAADVREQLLSEMTQGWRGAMEALTLASSRWHTLLQGEAQRAEKTAFVSSRMFDLYLAAGILRNLNRAAGAGYLSARLAGGFATLLRRLEMLSMPFDHLVYARDAEVVVNTSVDPTSDNNTLLGEREDDAFSEIERAHEGVGRVLEQARAEALNAEQLGNRMDNEINDLRDELVELCGMPVGCTADTFRSDPQCQVRVDVGKCGFSIDKATDDITGFGPGQQSVSQAGRALLDVTEAAQNISIADDEQRSLVERTQLELAELTAFATTIEEWNRTRLDAVSALQQNLAQRDSLRNERVKEIYDNLAERADMRRDGIESAQQTFQEWNQIRYDNATTDIGLMVAANSARETASSLRNIAQGVKDFGEASAKGLPTAVGTSNDVSAPARLALLMGTYGKVLAMRTGAVLADITAASLEIARETHSIMNEARMAQMEDQSALGSMIGDHEMAILEEELQIGEAQTDAELARLEEIIELARAHTSAQLAYERDYDEFLQRRLALRQKLTYITGLDLRLEQTHLQFDQAVAGYLAVVQQAELRDTKLNDLQRQRANVNRLVGSPQVIFSRANRLEQAEMRLERAKDKMMDWLVALEYLAVRPFMDQRQQILLARNTYQLEEIAQELKRLQRNCGGAVNTVQSTISVKRDLLGLTQATIDPATGEVLTPDERFREILSRGYVPIDKRVRYSNDETIGALMARDPDIMAATFHVELENFANLDLTCNAKIASLDIQLVGDLEEARPTVSVLYDGTSKLASCQPGIDDYVELFGPDTSNYGSITHLRTSGRSISPVAGVNEFVGASTTLAGLPLASQYTLLIDTNAGENRRLDWSQIEDVELQVSYTYQDIFPVGQCE